MTSNHQERAQKFWLDRLGEAENFNRWVFESFEPWLNGEILELGCGTGTFTALMAERNWRVTAVDIDPDFVEIAARRLSGWTNVEVGCADITRMKDGPLYDTIILLDVLEHIEDDVGLLKSISERLRAGGRLILKVPALPSIYSRLDEAIGHYRRYDKGALASRLKQAGLIPGDMRHLNALGILGWVINGKVLRRTTPPAMQVDAFDRIVPVACRIERALRLPVGLSLISLSTTAER